MMTKYNNILSNMSPINDIIAINRAFKERNLRSNLIKRQQNRANNCTFNQKIGSKIREIYKELWPSFKI